MRLTIVITIMTVLQLQATTSVGQRITYKNNNVTLIELFKEIQAQTGYNVTWDENKIDISIKLNVDFNNVLLKETLAISLKGLPVAYDVNSDDKSISIKYDAPSFLEKIMDKIAAIDVRGVVLDDKGFPLNGASVKVKGTNRSVVTNDKGEFYLRGVEENAILVISFLGYAPQEIKANANIGSVKLALRDDNLDEVQIVSTGYQDIPKERATGSFVQIDNALINRSVGTNILDRLDGVTSGLIFNRGVTNIPNSPIEIRGRSTLFSDGAPLIVLDNFPYEGDLGNINPNDIESVTVLKDAAAASVWGAKSGNGVIVITTKKGKLNAAPKLSFSSNINLIGKPDLFYARRLSSSQYIEVEDFLYDRGVYNNTINTGYLPLSPAVEIFLAKRNGTISEADSLAKINHLKTLDSRNQSLNYGYRDLGINQQYQVGIGGGSMTQKYFVSGGYDRNLGSSYNNSYDRITLRANNMYLFFKNKLEFSSNIIYTGSKRKTAPSLGSFAPYPYYQVADDNGSPIAVPVSFRASYAENAGNGKLLNWLYKPLDEQNKRYQTTTNNLTDYRINLSLNFNILKGLSASALYNYGKGFAEGRTLNELESYYTRNLINQFTQIDPITGAVSYPFPLGAILTTNQSDIKSNNGRFLVSYNHSWNKHGLNAISGWEIGDNTTLANTKGLYGYDPDFGTNKNNTINHTINYPLFYDLSLTGRISNIDSEAGTTDRSLSYFFNGSYNYDSKYIFSISARKDESNLFGVETNQKGVPLWSSGVAWVLNKEKFYNVNWLPVLKLRGTFGYTGTVNRNLSAYLTASQLGSSPIFNQPFAQVVNPPNPSLRWERTRNVNLGIDFATKGNRINGSVEGWIKTGLDLIGNSPIAAQTGITQFFGNSANTKTRGIDVLVNTVNLDGPLRWSTAFLYNYNHSRVTDYKVSNGNNSNVVSGNYRNPLEGYPYYAIFSYPYAGLDNNGNPQGYINGAISANYTGIRNSTNREDLVFHGSATPTSFGSIRNTFQYKGFDLSFNIIYKFNYFFRRESVTSSDLYSGSINYNLGDYGLRWQVPGDELKTNVPSLIYPANSGRDNVYKSSDVLVEKGDHIRLQDIRLGYVFENKAWLRLNNLSLFIYSSNLGILWKANKQNLDPDYPNSLGTPAPRAIAFGLTTSF